MVQKKASEKTEVSGLTVQSLLGIDNAIGLVGDLKFPMKIQYQLGKTKDQISTHIKNYNKAVTALRDELKETKDGRAIIPEKNMERWNKETGDLLQVVDNDLKLRTFSFTDFDFSDDEDYKDTKVPQNFTTLMFPLLTD